MATEAIGLKWPERLNQATKVHTFKNKEVCPGWGGGGVELVFNDRVSVWDDETFWRWMVVTIAQQFEWT